MAVLSIGAYLNNFSGFGDGNISVKTTDGTIRKNIYLNVSGYEFGLGMPISTSITYSDRSIVFGTGTTPVTFDDYSLENIISTGYSKSGFTFGTATYNITNKTWSCPFNVLLTNSNSSALTFNEVGIVAPFNTYNGTSLNQYNALIYREVLSTPITIAANDVVKYTQIFEYIMPTI
jgi:hypothetical protein